MKLLAFADLHLDVPFAWADHRTARIRRANLRRALENIVRLAQTESVDYLLSAGDLFEHERIGPDTIEFLRATLGGSGIPTFLAPGNHDWFGPESPYARSGWGTNVRIFTEDHLVPEELADGVTLWGAAHRVPANTDDFFAGFHVDRAGVNLALLHASETSALPWQPEGKRPHAPFDAAEIATAGVDFALLGHYHYPSEGNRYAYMGNPDPLEFGEVGQRGAVLVTISGSGRIELSRRSVAVSRVHDITVNLDAPRHRDEVAEAVRAAVGGLDGSVRVTLCGELSSGVELHLPELSEVAPHLDALVVRTRDLSVAYDLDALAKEPTVRGQFVRDANEQVADAATRRRVILTGLRALDGRRDLEAL